MRTFVAAAALMLVMLGYIVVGHRNILGAQPAAVRRPAAILPKTGTSGSGARGGWLPIVPNFAYVPAYTPAGKPVYLNIRLTSLLFFDPSNAGSISVPSIAKEVLARGNHPRPLVLVAVVHTTSVKRAAAKVGAFMTKYHVAVIPVVLQQGPPLVSTYPTLVWFSGGKVHAHAGMPTAKELAQAMA